MNSVERIVTIGAGPAAMKAAESLRAQGYAGSLTLIGADEERPYDRPPLSKEYLQGEKSKDELFFQPPEWFADNAVDLRLGTEVVALDRAAREVIVADGSRIGYDRLLIATGARPRRLDVPGSHLPGVRYLRTLADSDALRSAFERGGSACIIGGGWIGLETAAAARIAGLNVTVIEQAELPLLRVLGREVAQIFADLHRGRGVTLRCGAGVKGLIGTDSVRGVELDDGSVLEADVVVAGVGVAPNVEVAEASGLAVDNGVVVDEMLRTSDPAIWAAGDVASAHHPVLGRRIRIEHIENATRQGTAVAGSLLDRGEPYSELPFFFTDQYDLGMEYVGHVEPGGYDRVVLRGDVGALRFLAFWLSEGRVSAGMHVNEWDATEGIRSLIEAGRPVDPDRLADAGVPLEDV